MAKKKKDAKSKQDIEKDEDDMSEEPEVTALSLLDPEADFDAIGKQIKETVELTSDDFYEVAGKTTPNARALQWMANKKEISTKVIGWGSDDQKAWAQVRGWIGHESHPIIVKEAIVILEYKIEQLSFLLNKQLKRKWNLIRDETGAVAPTNDTQRKVLYDYMVRKREFGVREAITKAEGIVNKKLLSMEFREKSEIDGEKEEIAAVQQQIKIQKGTYQPTNEGTGGKAVEPPQAPAPLKKLPPAEPLKPTPVGKESGLTSIKKPKKGKKQQTVEGSIPETYDMMTIQFGKKKTEVYLPKNLEPDKQRAFLMGIVNEKRKEQKNQDQIVMKLCDQLLTMLKGKNLSDQKIITDKKVSVIWEMLIENNPNIKITPIKK